jgi:hypothetical protein
MIRRLIRMVRGRGTESSLRALEDRVYRRLRLLESQAASAQLSADKAMDRANAAYNHSSRVGARVPEGGSSQAGEPVEVAPVPPPGPGQSIRPGMSLSAITRANGRR